MFCVKELVEQINSSDVNDSERHEAKSALRQLMDNPVVAGVLGGATSGILALLG
ncbi:hypothetical protein [Photobacterium angustum]|uniref:hypothetical protein n=1 Tax=Photobacterium angustum TaxID=661 RepID=UPI000AA23859|nr:hypothetical protein [Photobacterium angustum]